MARQPLLIPLERRVRSLPAASELDPASLLTGASNESVILIGDARRVLAEMPDCIFQTCVTSPPYWSLRNYHIEGQIGLEPSLDDYIESLVDVFEQVRRTLRDDGVLWLNIGDSYTSGGRTWRWRPLGRWLPSTARRGGAVMTG